MELQNPAARVQTGLAMYFARNLAVAVLSSWLLASLPAGASQLVTGNGFGFAVVSPETATATKFYAHPYSFVRPDPKNPLGEGIETTNFIKSLNWSDPAARGTSVNYETDSHVIRARNGAGEGYYFMPFGLKRPALVVSFEPAAAAPPGKWKVEWSHP